MEFFHDEALSGVTQVQENKEQTFGWGHPEKKVLFESYHPLTNGTTDLSKPIYKVVEHNGRMEVEAYKFNDVVDFEILIVNNRIHTDKTTLRPMYEPIKKAIMEMPSVTTEGIVAIVNGLYPDLWQWRLMNTSGPQWSSWVVQFAILEVTIHELKK